LKRFVKELEAINKQDRERSIVLLADGYDEISTEARKEVSNCLFTFAATGRGEYFLTCRDFYEIFDLKAPHFQIMEFTAEDQRGFVGTFLHAYGSSTSPNEIMTDLQQRGLGDLLRHPLILTLACIVKSSSLDFRAKNITSLIEAAIQTLSLRWDQGKGLRRESTTPLDAAARVKCLKRLAFYLELEPARQQRVLDVTRKQLELMRWDTVDPLSVLNELAQFYGMLVPMADKWGFVHRSLQDYLAAQYWVETGQFASAVQAGNIPMNSRTAYAACLIDDATSVMEATLSRFDGLPTFAEMLMNDASFNHSRIAALIVSFYEKYKGEHYYRRTEEKLECNVADDFVSDASSKFLDYVVQVCGPKRGKTTDTLVAYAIVELVRRNFSLSQRAFAACKQNFGRDSFVFDVIPKTSSLKLRDVPHH
jgi:hypothetical protein